MVRQRTHDLEIARERAENFSRDLVDRLTTIAEFRDYEEGPHVMRVGILSGLIASKMNMHPKFIQLLQHSSPMHDIGKINITDTILFKKEALTTEEFDVVKAHTWHGKKILSGFDPDVLNAFISLAPKFKEVFQNSFLYL